jgi:hypothetical protein
MSTRPSRCSDAAQQTPRLLALRDEPAPAARKPWNREQFRLDHAEEPIGKKQADRVGADHADRAGEPMTFAGKKHDHELERLDHGKRHREDQKSRIRRQLFDPSAQPLQTPLFHCGRHGRITRCRGERSRRAGISAVTFLLTFVTVVVTLTSISLCKGRRSRGCSRLCGASAVPAGGTTHSAPGRLRASCRPALRPAGGVLPLDWDRFGRVTPADNCAWSPPPGWGGRTRSNALTASQEAWPEVARHGRKPVRQNRGGTPTGELPRKGSGRASCTAYLKQRLPAFRFPFSFES